MTAENDRIMQLALGRIFRMGAQPMQPGDVAEYERCRAIIMEIHESPDYPLVDTKPLPGWNFGRGNDGVLE